MANYKKLMPGIFIVEGKAVKWFDDKTVVSEDVPGLAKHYSERGADGILLFDLAESEEEQETAIGLIRKIRRAVQIPLVVGGNVRRLEDVKKILYAGAGKVLVTLSGPEEEELLKAAAARFGKERMAVALNDFDTLVKNQELAGENAGEIFFMHSLDLHSIVNVAETPGVILTNTMDAAEILEILECPAIRGVSGGFVSNLNMDFRAFKERCTEAGIPMPAVESLMEFPEFRTDAQGLLPVVVQDDKTGDVLMLAYMNEEAFRRTIESGRMTYYSRSRKALWVKGETSGHFQFVRALMVDCDGDTLLARVEQVGAACHTGNPTCFFRPVSGMDAEQKNPRRVLENVYDTIAHRKAHPKEGSYTNYLFGKGIDKILKKLGEEAAEIIIAAKNPDPEEMKYEMADFLYHAMALMVERGVSWKDIEEELAGRQG